MQGDDKDLPEPYQEFPGYSAEMHSLPLINYGKLRIKHNKKESYSYRINIGTQRRIMPSATLLTSPLLSIHPLGPELRKDTLIGAEVVPNNTDKPIDPDTFCPEDIVVLRQALYDNTVLVIRKQQGIDPLALEKIAAIWDEDIINVHSAGKEQIRDPRSILSANNGARLPRAQNVQIIGNGEFEGYEGIDYLNLHHVVSICCDNTTLALIIIGLCGIPC